MVEKRMIKTSTSLEKGAGGRFDDLKGRRQKLIVSFRPAGLPVPGDRTGQRESLEESFRVTIVTGFSCCLYRIRRYGNRFY